MPDTTGVLIRREVLEVSNEDAAPLWLFLEPWAESYVIPAHTVVEVVAFAPAAGHLIVDDADNRRTVWGWTGSSVHVLRDGQELEPSLLSSADASAIACQRTRTPVVRQKDDAPMT